jgi:hypothetical protein
MEPVPLRLKGASGWANTVAAAAVLVLVLTSMDPTGASTEIEPFKTAITSKFHARLAYVLYAGALLAVGLFSERAYCRSLPLPARRSARLSRSPATSSTCSSAVPNVAIPVTSASGRVQCAPSSQPARS